MKKQPNLPSTCYDSGMGAKIDIDSRKLMEQHLGAMRRRAAGGSFLDFIGYVNRQYNPNWHHKKIIRIVENFLADPARSRLMLFMPPQHGKSEITSRLLPPFALGMNPDLQVAACSYSADLARKFNRQVQRTIDSDDYVAVFPQTRLNSRRVSNDTNQSVIRNTEEFEIVGHRGSYKSVGIGGGLSGRRVDLAIIDDPVKDAAAAYSEKIREAVWDWYLSVLSTRLHNQSKVLLIMTRWHQDDLAGRLLKHEPEQWEVISIPAILEDPIENDPRQIGDALWPERHSLERLREIERISPTWFAALYQQRPSPRGGGLIKSDWFGRYRIEQLPPGPVNLYVDPAYTEKKQNDPTGVMAYKVHQGRIYVLHVTAVRKGFPEFCAWLPEYARAVGYDESSRIRIEPKASGISIVQQLQASTGLNVIAAPTPKGDKTARIESIGPILESGRVLLPEQARGGWLDQFLGECEAFPNGAHDDRVDCLEGAARCELVMEELNQVRRTN